LLASGEVRCWGNGSFQESANATLDGTWNLVKPRVVPLPKPARILRATLMPYCAVLEDDSVFCWEADKANNLVVTRQAEGAVDIAVGYGFACALHRAGTVSCWGDNHEGQLGDGTTQSRTKAAPVPGLSHVKQVVANGSYACAHLERGEVLCWGHDDVTELIATGGLKTKPLTTPTAMKPLSGIRELRAAEGSLCALLADDGVACVLANGIRLPLPLPASDRDFLQNHPGEWRKMPWKNVKDVILRDHSGCVTFKNGSVRCDGETPEWGDVGDSKMTSYLRGAQQVSFGPLHRCALRKGTDAKGMPKVVCWGRNSYGNVGKPWKSNSRNIESRPVPIRW